MGLKVTQEITSKQATIEPRALNKSASVPTTARQFQRSQTPSIPLPVDPKSQTSLDMANPLRGASIAPLVTSVKTLEATGIRLSERVNGWGGRVVFFLDTFPNLGLSVVVMNKWVIGVVNTNKWVLSPHSRYELSIEGYSQ